MLCQQVTADNPQKLAQLHTLQKALQTLLDPKIRREYDSTLTGKVRAHRCPLSCN